MTYFVVAALGVLVVWGSVIGIGMMPVLLPLAITSTTVGAPGEVPVQAAMPIFGPVQGEDAALMQAIQPWYGTRYVLGGNGPPQGVVDCSGFTVAVYRQLGYALPRTAQAQFSATQNLMASPQPRDLVFFHSTYDTGKGEFITHVGIYIGGGMMVSAIVPVLGRQSLGDPYWRAHFAGFGRLRRN